MASETAVDVLLDGLQSLTTWETYFNNPSPGTLGM